MNTAKKGRIHKGGIITRVVSRNWLATMVSTYIYDIMYLYIYIYLVVFIYDTMYIYIYYYVYIYILFVCTTYILQYVYIYNVLSIDWINQGY